MREKHGWCAWSSIKAVKNMFKIVNCTGDGSEWERLNRGERAYTAVCVCALNFSSIAMSALLCTYYSWILNVIGCVCARVAAKKFYFEPGARTQTPHTVCAPVPYVCNMYYIDSRELSVCNKFANVISYPFAYIASHISYNIFLKRCKRQNCTYTLHTLHFSCSLWLLLQQYYVRANSGNSQRTNIDDDHKV